MKNKETLSLLIRADAGPAIGIGHVMRCIALGQAWRLLGGTVCFLCAELPDLLRSRLLEEGFHVESHRAEIGSDEDASCTLNLASALGADWLALDGYNFGIEFQQAIQADKCCLLLIDDYAHLDEYVPDVLLAPPQG